MSRVNLHGVRLRIVVSIIANLARVAIAFVTGLLIARSLGPGRFGDYTFVLGSFAAFTSLTDLGMSNAFYTLMSRARRNLRFVGYYGGWLLLQVLALAVLVAFAPHGVFSRIWLGQPRRMVLLALLASFVSTQVWAFTAQIGESVRDTVGVQVRNLAAAVLFMVVVLIMANRVPLTAELLFWATAIIYFVFSVGYALKLHRAAHLAEDAPIAVREMVHEYRAFFYPSAVVLGFLFTFLDPWLLQRFAGSVQQGYYSVAIRLSSVALLMTSAVIQVMWKEVAEAYAVRNMERVRQMRLMATRGLCFVSAILAGGILPFAREVLAATLGGAYSDALFPFSLLLIYPMYQALHVVNDTALLAIGEAKIRSRIVVSFFAVSIVTSYLFVAPRTAAIPGLGLGATGLALKMVVCQVVQANAASYFASHRAGAKFDWIHQFLLLGVIVPLGYVARFLSELVLPSAAHLPIIVLPAVSSVLYALLLLGVLWRFPRIVGMTREQLDEGWQRLRARLPWGPLARTGA